MCNNYQLVMALSIYTFFILRARAAGTKAPVIQGHKNFIKSTKEEFYNIRLVIR